MQQLQLQQTNEQLQQLRLQFELLHRQHDDMTLQYRQAEMDIMELSDWYQLSIPTLLVFYDHYSRINKEW